MTKKYFLNVCVGLFLAASLLHLARALAGWAWQIGPFSVPLWASWAAFAVTAAMALWARRLHRG